MQKRSASSAFLAGKCPRCRQGDMFEYPLSYVHKFTHVHEKCPCCDLMYQREPGFFFGAMYISYAFSVAIMVTVGVALTVLGYESIYTYLGTVLGVILLLFPFSYRYSRIIFLWAFGGVKFDAHRTCTPSPEGRESKARV
jgi:uncharacterized protein (DUF983 family)